MFWFSQLKFLYDKSIRKQKAFYYFRSPESKRPSIAADDKRGHRMKPDESEAPYRISIIMSSSSSDESLL